ncbi:MAG TPA: disulfide bond formation protein B [Candidatus Paceibacterota bacterium]|nr:disulfide bond formation protein B [Candidatus Paceibacterota bacterium]
MRKRVEKWLKQYVIYFVYAQIWAGFFGSLYFSEVLKLPPCVLCTVQRLLLYPLIIVLSVGIWRRDEDLPWYVLPFSILGIIVAGYHNLIYYHIIPESLTPCTVQLPCTVRDFTLWGVISIPTMSLVAFILITIGIILHDRLRAYRDC